MPLYLYQAYLNPHQVSALKSHSFEGDPKLALEHNVKRGSVALLFLGLATLSGAKPQAKHFHQTPFTDTIKHLGMVRESLFDPANTFYTLHETRFNISIPANQINFRDTKTISLEDDQPTLEDATTWLPDIDQTQYDTALRSSSPGLEQPQFYWVVSPIPMDVGSQQGISLGFITTSEEMALEATRVLNDQQQLEALERLGSEKSNLTLADKLACIPTEYFNLVDPQSIFSEEYRTPKHQWRELSEKYLEAERAFKEFERYESNVNPSLLVMAQHAAASQILSIVDTRVEHEPTELADKAWNKYEGKVTEYKEALLEFAERKPIQATQAVETILSNQLQGKTWKKALNDLENTELLLLKPELFKLKSMLIREDDTPEQQREKKEDFLHLQAKYDQLTQSLSTRESLTGSASSRETTAKSPSISAQEYKEELTAYISKIEKQLTSAEKVKFITDLRETFEAAESNTRLSVIPEAEPTLFKKINFENIFKDLLKDPKMLGHLKKAAQADLSDIENYHILNDRYHQCVKEVLSRTQDPNETLEKIHARLLKEIFSQWVKEAEPEEIQVKFKHFIRRASNEPEFRNVINMGDQKLLQLSYKAVADPKSPQFKDQMSTAFKELINALPDKLSIVEQVVTPETYQAKTSQQHEELKSSAEVKFT